MHFTNAYHPTSGGIKTFYRALLARANDRQRPMRLVVPGAHEDEEPVGDWGRIYHVKSPRAPAFDRRYRLMLPGAYLPPAQGAITRILQREQPDLVDICDKYSLFYLAALLRRHWLAGVSRPALVGVSCERMDDSLRAYLPGAAWSRPLSRRYLRHIYGPPFDCHVANSEYTADELRQALWDRAPNFIRVCPMGVDSVRFGPEHRDESLRRHLLERAGGDGVSVLMLYAGRLSPEKNVGLLLRMTERLMLASTRTGDGRDYRLVLVGDGPSRAAIEGETGRLRDRVLLVGSVTSVDLLRRYYASADVFVHPNPREPFGIAPLEAMASGVPVVVPSAGGVLSYASHANAWLAAAEPDAFANAVRSALEHPDPDRLRRARETAVAHEWSRVADQWFDLYDSIYAETMPRHNRQAS